MARSDTSTLVIGGGKMYTAPVGTAAPADLTAPGEDWEEIGHTSRDDIFSMATEGGEVTVLGTLQVAELRTKRSPRSDTFRINLVQWDEDTLAYYFGSNAEIDADTGMLGVPSEPAPVEKAYLAVFSDGARSFGVYAPKAELSSGESIDFSDTDSLSQLPIDVKPLQSEDFDFPWYVTPLA